MNWYVCRTQLRLSVMSTLWLLLSSAAIAQSREVVSGAESERLWARISERSPWVFLGDSNTYAGGYVATIDACLSSTLPNSPHILNLGVASETCSGESEPDHPFRRPCVHERIDKVLAMTRPGVVFVCYGMNDGIYYPYTEGNHAAFVDGMLRLAAAVRESGAILVCLTPPIFEPEPIAATGKLGPKDEGKGRYAWFAPAADYDSVLEKQAEWCLGNAMQADLVIDIRSPLVAGKQERQRVEPGFQFTRDGIHFGAEAEAIIVDSVLRALGAPPQVLDCSPDASLLVRYRRKNAVLRDAYLSATGKNRPGLPAGLPVWHAERMAESVLDVPPKLKNKE